MTKLFIYLIAIVFTYGAIWIIKPDLVNSFINNFPHIQWSDTGLVLIFINFSLLALSLSIIRNTNPRSNSPIIKGGLIASSSVGSMFSLSFVFNILWSAVTPKYLCLLMIGIYVTHLGGPMLVYSLKESESESPSDYYRNAQLISNLKKVSSEMELYVRKNNIETKLLELLGAHIFQLEHGGKIENSLVLKSIDDILDSLEFPAPLLQKIHSVKSELRET